MTGNSSVSALATLQSDSARPEDRPLTTEVVTASLVILAHNAEGRLVYAQSNLSSLSLTSIEVLGLYTHLQRLSLDNNMLQSLKPLQQLHSLVYLSAVNNRLTDDVFDDLATSGTTLERLNLSGNDIASLAGLRQLPFLMDFSAAENRITELCSDHFRRLHSLTRLNLRNNDIEQVRMDTFALCDTVRSLDLSFNKVTNAQFVMHLGSNMETLNLEHNRVESLKGFEFLSSLVALYLADNNIHAWEELNTLSELINLRTLTIEENPILEVAVASSSSMTQRGEIETKVAYDVDFAASRIPVQASQTMGASLNSMRLSTMTAPPARSRVQHLPVTSHEMDEWDNESHHELAQLPQSDQHRFRVISILRQLLTLNAVPVAPEEIPRAMRLFKRRRGKKTSIRGKFFPAGSAARAVESQREKNGGVSASV